MSYKPLPPKPKAPEYVLGLPALNQQRYERYSHDLSEWIATNAERFMKEPMKGYRA